jgi:hypothetical protein
MIRAIHEQLDESPFDGVAQWGGKNPLHFNSFKENMRGVLSKYYFCKVQGGLCKIT